MRREILAVFLVAAIYLVASSVHAEPYAVSVFSYNNTDALDPFTDPSEALGAPDGTSGAPCPYGVVSLGRYGSISLQLGQAVLDISGPDLIVWEELTYQWDGVPGSEGHLPDETADVSLSFNAIDWTLVGQVVRGDRDSLFIDINGTGMSGATYLRLDDVTGNGTPSGANGFDLDAITVIPEPATMSLLALGVGAVFIRKRRRA